MRNSICCAALALAMGTASGAEITPGALDTNSSAVFLTGRIQLDDGAKLRFLIRQAETMGVRVKFVVLNSPGGVVAGGADLAIVIRDEQLSVAVLDGQECASACFMPFAAGKQKIVAATARIGVHSASVGGLEPERAKSATVDMARFLHEFGVPELILGRLVRTTPNTIGWLTPDELSAMQSIVIPEQPRSMPYVERIAPEVAPNVPIRKAVNESEFRSARALNDQALLWIKNGNYVGAVSILRDASEINPYDVEISGNLGYAELKAGEYAKAKATLLLALQLRPSRWATWQNLGQSMAALGDTSGASLCFEKYVEHSPNRDRALSVLKRWKETDPSQSLRVAASEALNRIGG